MFSLRHKLLFALGVLLGLLILFVLVEHFRGVWALKRWQAKMEAQGEKFKIEDWIPPAPAREDNGFSDLLNAAGQLLANPRVTQIAPANFQYVAPGKVILTRVQAEWEIDFFNRKDAGLTNANWRVLGEELEKVSAALSNARAALKLPAFDGNLDYRAGMNLLLPHLSRVRSTAHYLAAATGTDLHQGDLDSVLENLLALAALTQHQGKEKLVISQMVRRSIFYYGLGATWQALHAPGWNDDQLGRIQAAWQSVEFLSALEHSFSMERAMGKYTYGRMRRSGKEVSDTMTMYQNMFGPGSSAPTSFLFIFLIDQFPAMTQRAVYVSLWRFAWSHQDELNYQQLFQAMIDNARRAAVQKSAFSTRTFSWELESEDSDTFRNRDRKDLNFYDRWRFLFSFQSAGSLTKTVGLAVQCETQRELMLAAIALKRYELRHSKLPSELQALVPEFLPALPRDYMDGQPLRYRLKTDGSFVLYSVGSNGIDDGGDPSFPNKNFQPRFLNGPDVVWPAPASAEEITAYQAKTTKRKK